MPDRTDSSISTPRRSAQAEREVRKDTAMRQARTCYDHLAGVAGVGLMDEMLRRGWLQIAKDAPRPDYSLTQSGEDALGKRGVDVTRAKVSKRKFAYGCLDWTERRAHLGGALGAAILEALRDDGAVQRSEGTRTVATLKPVTGWLKG